MNGSNNIEIRNTNAAGAKRKVQKIHRIPLIQARMKTKSLFLILSILFALVAVAMSASEASDSFLEELDYLQRQNAGKIGVPALIDAYEKFISKYESDSRVARAMVDLGSKYQAEWAGKDPKKALEWFGVAAKTATPNTEIWKKANFRVIDYYLYAPFIDYSRAEKILLDMKSHLKDGDIVFSMELEKKYVDVYGVQGRLDEAEKHCGNVLTVYHDPARVPKNILDKSKIDGLIGSSSGNMIAYIENSVYLPATERLLRIQKLGRKYPLLTQFHSYLPTINRLKGKVDSEVMSIASEQLIEQQSIGDNHIVQKDNSNGKTDNASIYEPNSLTDASTESQATPSASPDNLGTLSRQRIIFICAIGASILMLSWFVLRKIKAGT
jgi:hypothetical protein